MSGYRVCSLVSGSWRENGVSEPLTAPYSGEEIGRFFESTPNDVEDAVTEARAAFERWSETPAYARRDVLVRLADLIDGNAHDLAHAITVQTGKVLRDSRQEVARSAIALRLSAEEATRIDGDVIALDAEASGTNKLGFTLRLPVGVVAAITPFNVPLSSAAHKIGPALAAGNAVVLKPHPLASAVGCLFAQLALEAGVPKGLVNVLQGGEEPSRRLVTHPGVDFVNFTGSGTVASAIVREIGMKRTLLELGGNAPTIVHGDADLDAAVKRCLAASFGLSGQSCISTQRIYVHTSIFDRFTDAFVESARSLCVGDPLDPTTDVGPLIHLQTVERLSALVQEAVDSGARVLCGGSPDGTLFPPTVLVDVDERMNVMCDEVFGPVASLAAYEDIDDALRWCNDTPYGLKAGIFTASLEIALRAARRLEYGTVNINGPSRGRTEHEPTGGLKQSGWGKEGPRYAIREMSYLKMVNVASVI